jgi:hypothetical protein
MADSIVGGMFGITPESYLGERQLLEQAQALRQAKLDPYEAVNYMAARAGQQLGRGIGGLLGAEDPQLQRISQFENLARRADITTPEGMRSLGEQLLQGGDTARGMEAIKRSQEMELKESQITRNLRERQGFDPIQQIIRSGKFTPESIEKYSKSGAISDLRTLDKPNQAGLPTIAKLQSYRDSLVDQLGENHPKVKEVDQAIKAETQGKGTTVNVGLSTVDKESNLRKDFTLETKPLTTAISAADKIEKLLKSNTSLGDIIAKKQFAKVAGDNNISNRDVAELANYGDLGQRLAGTLSQFFEGKYTQGQREEALTLVNQLKGEATNQYSIVQKDYRNRADAEKLPAKTSQFIAPDLPIKAQASLPPEGTKLRNKKTGKIEIVRGGKLVPAE